MSDLLKRPRDEACRVVALAYLDDALAARVRLGADPEALHDLRVALRRLRSTLRAYRDSLGRPLRRRERRRLRRIVQATSRARDAEVLLTMLEKEAGALDAVARPGVEWLSARLTERKLEGYTQVGSRLDHFARLERRLRRRLSRVRLDLSHPHVQAHALGALIESHSDEVEDDLAELHSADQVEEAHAARISVKRLRYLIEPFKDDVAVARLVSPLKALQDLLGELHDAHVAIAEVDGLSAEAETAVEIRAGLEALAGRFELREVKLFAALQREWLSGGALVTQARALAGELARR